MTERDTCPIESDVLRGLLDASAEPRITSELPVVPQIRVTFRTLIPTLPLRGSACRSDTPPSIDDALEPAPVAIDRVRTVFVVLALASSLVLGIALLLS
jgi:hypothetical protein